MSRQGSGALYAAFGLTFASQIDIPELSPAEGPADVEIRLGAAPAALTGGFAAGPGVTALPGALLLESPPARFLVREGREVIVEPRPGSRESDVRVYLLGSAMGAVLHQRGVLPLHANAIEFEGCAVAFAGPSGAGKSTLAAQFLRRGHRVLGDDVCAVSFDGAGAPLVWPGVPRIKLWADAIKLLGLSADELQRVYEGEEKFSLPIAPVGQHMPAPLTRLYVLDAREEGTAVRALAGAEAVNAIIANIYRWAIAEPLGQSRTQLANALLLARAVPVFAAGRHWRIDGFASSANELERHFGRDFPRSSENRLPPQRRQDQNPV